MLTSSTFETREKIKELRQIYAWISLYFYLQYTDVADFKTPVIFCFALDWL